MRFNRKNIWLALALTAPMLVFYAGYLFYHAPELKPTGFIQYDNVSYVAFARQYQDAETFHIQYANPFNEKEYKAIYFQPQTLFFWLLLKSGIPPAWILIPFNLLFSLICFLILIAIYDHLVPFSQFRRLNIWLFAWGGGLLAITGMFAWFYLGQPGSFMDGFFILDPERGWWGLNLGRALFFSCEAYYHALFLGCIYALLRRKWITGFILLFLLSLSHPFSGIELIGIVLFWCLVEYFVNRKRIPIPFIAAVVFALCFHIYFYLVYLNGFPDHQSVSEQYALNWRLRFFRMIPAYCLTASLALASIYSAGIRNFFRNRANRLFASWFLVAFALANHELFLTPRQPVHFTRGYIWSALFLLGLPALLQLNQYFKTKWRKMGLLILAMLFLMDNFLWIINIVSSKAFAPDTGYITQEQKNILKLLDRESTTKTLVISSDNNISYLSAVYTGAYPWYSHPYTTPFAEKKRLAQKNFIFNGIIDTSWISRDVNFVLHKNDSLAISAVENIHPEKKWETAGYYIFSYRPGRKP